MHIARLRASTVVLDMPWTPWCDKIYFHRKLIHWQLKASE